MNRGQHEHRQAVNYCLTENLSYADVQVGLGGHKQLSYVKKARTNLKDEKHLETALFTDQARSAARPRGMEQVCHAISWLKEEMAVPQSGDKSEVYRSFVAVSRAYQDYLEAALDGEQVDSAGFKLFQEAWTELGVKKASHSRFDFFSCVICNGATARIKVLQSQVEKLRNIDGSERAILCLDGKVAAIEAHCLITKAQRNAFLTSRSKLRKGVLHLTADFGTFPIQNGTGKVADLVLVFAYFEGDAIQTQYVDCIPYLDGIESKDWCFVESAIRGLHSAGFFRPFSEILWWSDTGPNHFRVSNTLYFFRLFQIETGLKIQIHFFAPYHGHSKCDGHIGAIARKLTLYSQKFAGTTDVWDKSFVEKSICELKRTFLTKHIINRRNPRVETLKGIKGFLIFSFDESVDNSVDCQIMDGAKVQRQIFTLVPEGDTTVIEDTLDQEQGLLDETLYNHAWSD